MNALRLAFGTLSIYPVRPPSEVNRRMAGWAMALGPLVAATLALPLWGLARLTQYHWSPLVVAALWVAGLGLLTRAMHLDGLADTADGLGSRQPAETALAVMRKSDVGPFGVATLVLVLLVQVAASAQLLAGPAGPVAVVTAVVLSRLILPLACLYVVPAGRPGGLGATVAGSVGRGQLLASLALTGLLVAAAALVAGDSAWLLLRASGGLLAGGAFCWWCVRRLGGITGDVLGACVEVTFTAALLMLL